MTIAPPRILAHNILRSIVGQSSAGVPLCQVELLEATGSLPPATAFLSDFAASHAGLQPAPFSSLLTTLAPEFTGTIIPVLTQGAYYSTPFHPQAFGDALTDPAAWLGRSYYRIRNLAERLSSNPSIAQIETTIRMTATLEAAAAYACITQITTPVTIIDPDIFAREAGEDASDII